MIARLHVNGPCTRAVLALAHHPHYVGAFDLPGFARSARTANALARLVAAW
jgi:hypothetical protein